MENSTGYSENYKKLAKSALEDIYNGGACNPTPMVRVMGEIVAEARQIAGTELKSEAYAPMRLILAQLNYLVGAGIGSYPGVENDIAFVESLK